MKFAMTLIMTIFLITNVSAYRSLQEIYDDAVGNGDYDKYIELDPAEEYDGDLSIFDGMNVFIDGNGAIIHGQEYYASISVYSSNLDIQNCVLVGGFAGIYISNLSSGTIVSNTIDGCVSAAIKTYYIDHDAGTYIWDNIITNCDFGIFIIEEEHPEYIAFNNIYNIEEFPYAEYCPG